MTALLVHAVLRADVDPELNGLGIVDGAPLSLVRSGSLQALVSSLPADLADTLLSDPETATALAVRHHACLTELTRTADLAPVRLGAAYSNKEAVRRLLDGNAGFFSEALARVSGASEFALRLTAEGAAGRSAAANSVDGRSFLQRRSAEAQARRVRAEMLYRTAQTAFERLACHAIDHAFPEQRTSRQPDQVLRLLDAALLVPRASFAEFEAAVLEAQVTAAEAGCRLQVAGPLPPYTFVAATETRDVAA